MSATTLPTPEQSQRAKCSVADCGRLSHAHGFCSSHYYRWRRHGSPTAGGFPAGSVRAFISAAAQYVGDDCLLWPYAKSPNGYGHARVNRRYVDCHVQVCEAVHGPKPSAKHEVAHSCGVRPCCNPAHLRWDIRKNNAADRVLHGTHLSGERHGQAKLSARQVLEIRAQRHRTQISLAAEFGVAQTLISQILAGKIWKQP